MILQSIAVLALALPNLSTHIHLHARPQPDTRVHITLLNNSTGFRDVKINGQTYTVFGGHTLTVKAPAGTEIYTASTSLHHRSGEILAALTPAMDNSTVNLF